MTSLRGDLITAMNQVLERRMRTLPDQIPVIVPVAELADAVITTLTNGRGVPRVPAYDPELVPQRRWHGAVDQEALADGAGFPSVGVRPKGGLVEVNAAGVVSTGAVELLIPLPANDAEEFATNVLSAVGAARATTSAPAAI